MLLALGVERMLCSYIDIKQKATQYRMSVMKDLMLDCGAFGVETGTGEVMLYSYTKWLLENLSNYPNLTTYVSLDDISNPDISKKNVEYMEACSLAPMPVYHYGEPPEYLDDMCNNHDYIGLGGLVTKNVDTAKLKQFWERTYENYPGKKFHIFGIGVPTPFQRYQPYSVDTTTWIGRHGQLLGYKNKLPCNLNGAMKDAQLFLTWQEIIANNVRAVLDWEKLEWLQPTKQPINQGRLL